MSARVFIHPRCWSGPGAAALITHLEERGYDCENIVVVLLERGRRELARRVPVAEGAQAVYERMDGSRFTVHPGRPVPEPGRAA